MHYKVNNDTMAKKWAYHARNINWRNGSVIVDVINSFIFNKVVIYYVYATTQNNREIDREHKIELYIATVSIKQKAVDRIKTVLRFLFNAMR